MPFLQFNLKVQQGFIHTKQMKTRKHSETTCGGSSHTHMQWPRYAGDAELAGQTRRAGFLLAALCSCRDGKGGPAC